MTNFPNFPMPGKNSKISISTNDGQALMLAEMTLQASATYRGETFVNRIYLLGAGKTLINMRPALQPEVDINGILDGVEITPGAAKDTVAVSAGTNEVSGASVAVPANAALALSVTTAANTLRWNAILADMAAGTLSITAGTKTSAGGSLLDTYGTGAGQRPLIAVDKLLAGWCAVGTAESTVVPANINYLDKESGGVDYELLPNVGGCKIQFALPKIHTGGVGRKVFFTGSYLDGVMSEIATGKDWSMSANSTDVSDTTYSNTYKQSYADGFGLTFSQLAADKKVMDAVFKRQGHCALRWTFANGFAWQSAATVVPNVANPTASMANISVTASLLDFPAEV